MKQAQAVKNKKLTWDVPHDVDGLTASFPANVSGTLPTGVFVQLEVDQNGA